MSKNLSYLSARKGLDTNLFEKIGDASKDGAPTSQSLKELAEEFLIGEANTFGTASFYDFTKASNRGKKAYICNGTACLCAGTQSKVEESLKSGFSDEEIGHMTCLGRCYEAGAFRLNGKNHSGMNPDQIQSLLDSTIEEKSSKYHVQSIGASILTANMADSKWATELIRKTFRGSPEDLLNEIEKSRIRGRGGAGFPLHVKLRTTYQTDSDVKYIACNADEGDPGAFSDMYLLEERPLYVLLGMLIAGYAVGAAHGVIYIRAEYPASVDRIEEAIKWLQTNELVGRDILGSGFDFTFKVIRAQGSYICGEETAMLASIEGQRPEVRIRPPFPAVQGLFRKPTVVNNVETLACLPYIIEHGGSAYSNIGTERSSGTKLISLNSVFKRPGLYEVDMGTPLSTVLNELGQGFKEPVKAFHIGGPLGGLVPLSKVEDLKVGFESFKENGFLLGHASIIAIPKRFPIIKYLEHLFEFTADESCGKCFPCRLGSKRGQELLGKSLHGDYIIDYQLFDDLLHALEEGSLCALGGGLPLPVRNALTYFKDELEPHFSAIPIE
jgi:NADH:ubiquinone oxidoreductase subunit F (NADH-binding)